MTEDYEHPLEQADLLFFFGLAGVIVLVIFVLLALRGWMDDPED